MQNYEKHDRAIIAIPDTITYWWLSVHENGGILKCFLKFGMLPRLISIFYQLKRIRIFGTSVHFVVNACRVERKSRSQQVLQLATLPGCQNVGFYLIFIFPVLKRHRKCFWKVWGEIGVGRRCRVPGVVTLEDALNSSAVSVKRLTIQTVEASRAPQTSSSQRFRAKSANVCWNSWSLKLGIRRTRTVSCFVVVFSEAGRSTFHLVSDHRFNQNPPQTSFCSPSQRPQILGASVAVTIRFGGLCVPRICIYFSLKSNGYFLIRALLDGGIWGPRM